MLIDENRFFREATMRICGNLDFEVALRDCLTYLHTLIPAQMLQATLFDRGLKAIRSIAMATLSDAKKVSMIWPLEDDSVRLFDDPDSLKAKILNRPMNDPISTSIINRTGKGEDKSFLVLFLAIKGSIIGNILLGADGNDQYTEEHLRLFSLLNEPFAIALSNYLRFNETNRLKEIMADDIRFLHHRLRRFSDEDIIGSDSGLKGVMEMVHEVSPMDSPVLLQGETGVGKEIIANAIHNLSQRKDRPFIEVNCGAIPDTLIDSELFGHEKGAFTGAVTQKRGYFERAEGGTIFLDEVAELPPHAQVRMLRVIQEKTINRVGGTDPVKVNIRIIAATHQNLEEMVKNGRFRADLWFRIHVFPIMIPPLRNRKQDIPSLISYFVETKAKELQLPSIPTLETGALELLMAYSWPGNVRELENVVERAIILCKGQPLTFNNMVWEENDTPLESAPKPMKSTRLDKMIKNHIQQVLETTNGKINGPGGAAELLGINPGTLRHRLRKLGIPFGRRSNF